MDHHVVSRCAEETPIETDGSVNKTPRQTEHPATSLSQRPSNAGAEITSLSSLSFFTSCAERRVWGVGLTMASADVLVLSSPPRQFRTFNMSSSPVMPSPSHFFQKRPVGLRTGSGAAPIPPNANASFTTASSLWKPLLEDTQRVETIHSSLAAAENDGAVGPKQSRSTKTKPRKPVQKKDALEDGKVARAVKRRTSEDKDVGIDGAEAQKPRKPRKSKTDLGLAEEGTVKEKKARKPKSGNVADPAGGDGQKAKAVRKPRAKKTNGEAQTKMPKSKVTKASATSTSKLDKVTETAKPEKPESVTTAEGLPAAFEDNLGTGLVEAVKRRPFWTPPKATTESAYVTPLTSEGSIDGSVALDGSRSSEERSRKSTDLFGSFRFNSTESHVVAKKVPAGAVMRKRKLEMVNTNNSASSSEAATTPKTKAPKKKARTITDQATSAYTLDGLPTKTAPLLQYFSYETTDGVACDGFKVPAKPRSRSPVKGPSKPGNGTAQAPILLSPESALKQVGNQDFVFGTSSQLAREESPTLLRDVHAAMQASNQEDDDPFADLREPTVSFTASRGKVVSSTKRTLWSAATRDNAGELLNVEIVDLANSPAAETQVNSSDTNTIAVSPAVPDNDGIWHDIEEIIPNAPPPQAQAEQAEASPELESVSRPPSNAEDLELSHKSLGLPKQSEPLPRATQSVKEISAKGSDLEKPDYSCYTTAELAKELASYRFKPVKNRDQMITLLERCWEGKQRVALGSLDSNLALPKSSSNQLETVPTKRPRGRPRKNSIEASPKTKSKSQAGKVKATETDEYLELVSDAPLSKVRTPKKTQTKTKQPIDDIDDIDDISDPDSPFTPSPPRRRPSQIRTPQLPLQTSASTAVEDSPDLSPTSSQLQLFKHITRAVTTAPPSQDPLNPSWHEKILLYDPIILEDLTVWLNTGALDKAGWDGEVYPGEVKKWCMSNSICCLWKENLRGAARSRY